MSPATTPNCDTCGRFMRVDPGSSWKLVIPADYWNGPDREVFRCKSCTEKIGSLTPSHNTADWTAGIVKETNS